MYLSCRSAALARRGNVMEGQLRPPSRRRSGRQKEKERATSRQALLRRCRCSLQALQATSITLPTQLSFPSPHALSRFLLLQFPPGSGRRQQQRGRGHIPSLQSKPQFSPGRPMRSRIVIFSKGPRYVIPRSAVFTCATHRRCPRLSADACHAGCGGQSVPACHDNAHARRLPYLRLSSHKMHQQRNRRCAVSAFRTLSCEGSRARSHTSMQPHRVLSGPRHREDLPPARVVGLRLPDRGTKAVNPLAGSSVFRHSFSHLLALASGFHDTCWLAGLVGPLLSSRLLTRRREGEPSARCQPQILICPMCAAGHQISVQG